MIANKFELDWRCLVDQPACKVCEEGGGGGGGEELIPSEMGLRSHGASGH